MESAESGYVKPQRSSMKRSIKKVFRSLLPIPYYLLTYRLSSVKIKSKTPRNALFDDFLKSASGPCLQIAVKEEYGQKYGDNWISVDRYDHGPTIDRHDDIQALEFEDDHFNAVVCWSVLEHVPDPHAAIREMFRVLKPGGSIWVQLPFLFPYHGDPHDYWRVTPSGLRMWMKDFEVEFCACDYWAGTRLVAATFCQARKPQR